MKRACYGFEMLENNPKRVLPMNRDKLSNTIKKI